MDEPKPPLPANSPHILARQKQAMALRAQGLTVRAIAAQMGCSIHVAQRLVARLVDSRLGVGDTAWTVGLSHRNATALLKNGFAGRRQVEESVLLGTLNEGAPGLSATAMVDIRRWLAEPGPAPDPPAVVIQGKAARVSSATPSEPTPTCHVPPPPLPPSAGPNKA